MGDNIQAFSHNNIAIHDTKFIYDMGQQYVMLTMWAGCQQANKRKKQNTRDNKKTRFLI